MTLLEAAQAVIDHRIKNYLDNGIEPYSSLVKAVAEAETPRINDNLDTI